MSILDDIGGVALKLGKGLVKEVVGNIFGDEQPTEEDKANIAKAEQAAVEKVQSELAVLKMEFDDKANARAREIALAQTGQKDRTITYLAIGTSVGFFGILVTMIFVPMQQTTQSIVNIMVGALAASWGMVISYYFGSSQGSKAKDETISKLSAE